jgi:spore germination protein
MSHGLDFGDPGVSIRESLALFGFPISEPFIDADSGWIVQYFERARLEHPPGHPDDLQRTPWAIAN